MHPLVTVIIPVYREPRLLGEALERLLADPYPRKEIIVVADCPDPTLRDLLRGYEGRVRVLVHEDRVGKAAALNEALGQSRGDIILFLDNDVVPASGGFLSGLARSMEGVDILELSKEVVRRDLISRMVYYDYVAFNFGSLLFHRLLGRCVALNGAAFAVRREAIEALGGFRRVPSEDFDLGLRAYLLSLRYGFSRELKVMNEAPRTWREWAAQRRRWSVGVGLWIKENYRVLLGILRRNLRLVVGVILTAFPSLVTVLLALSVQNYLAGKLAFLALLLASSRLYLLTPLTALLPYGLIATLLNNLLALVTGMLVFSIYYYLVCRKLGYSFRPLDFVLYYLIYSPVWLVLMVGGIAYALTVKNARLGDWKV